MSNQVTQQVETMRLVPPEVTGLLQRTCDCGTHTASGQCDDCQKKRRGTLQRSAMSNSAVAAVPSIVNEVLRSPGQPLDHATRAFFEPRFGRDFSHVRLHADVHAGTSARAVNALAYTVGTHIVLGTGQYAPETTSGRALLAHELTHVVQQHNGSFSGSIGLQSQSGDRFERVAELVASAITKSGSQPLPVREHASTPFIGRVNQQQTAAVLRQGTLRGSGLQFFPLQVTSTRIGPVSGEGGLAETTRTNLLVIVGQAMTLRRIAELLLPLWNSATPFTPAGATNPLPNTPLTADVLARALLVYNRYYLRVLSQPAPSMTGWAAGLRFPLPVEIEASGEGIVNSDLIQSLAGEFDAAWEPLLDQAASGLGTPAAATLTQEATAFLATATDINARGIGLAARSIRNPVEALPLVTAVFNQLNTGQFDVALAFMDNLVNQEISLLASQRAGAGILAVIRTALGAAPSSLSTGQQQSLTRANLMLGLVRTVTARDMPFIQPTAVSAAGVRMVGDFEGFCPNLYDDGMSGCGRGVGHCTIGLGHLVHRDPCDGRASETPFLSGITRPDADALLANELSATANRVRTQVTVPLSQQQFDAVVSFVFNTGRLNALLPDLNANQFGNIPGIMNQFTHSGGRVMGGLVTRRAAESTLFSTGTYPP